MIAEEEQNIDDLIDYKDFESNVESENEPDSFNDDIIKIYEDHKKNFAANNKSTEIQNPQRPISKYQRSHLSSNRNAEDERAILEIDHKFENFDEKLSEEDLQIFFLRFNKFIIKYKIFVEEFMENPKIYLNLGEFKELFKKIRFEISSAELNHLFYYNNNQSKEGYILGKQFLSNFRKEIKFFEPKSVSNDLENLVRENCLTTKEKQTDIMIHNKNTEQEENNLLQNENQNILNKENKNLKNPNNINAELFDKELKLLKDEIFQIVKKNENFAIATNKKLRQPLINRIKSSIPPSNRKFEDVNTIMNNFCSNPNLKPTVSAKTPHNQRPFSTTKSKPITSASIKNLLEEKSRKRKAEEEIIKLALEKRNKENERDCIKKMSEANQIAEKLGVFKSYTAYLDENEELICRVFDKIARSVSDINVKKFLFEYKKLKKSWKQKEESKNLKSNLKNTAYDRLGNDISNEDNLSNLNRESRQSIIKDILLNSLELKIQLKTQLRILRNKKLIDPNVIDSTMKLNNLDDDNISLNLQNIDFSYTLNNGYGQRK